MINITIVFTGTHPQTGQEVEISKVERENENDYNIDFFIVLIDRVLNEAVNAGGGKGLENLRSYHPQLSVRISSDEDEYLRPSFHLSSTIISRLSAAGASFDFDPYV